MAQTVKKAVLEMEDGKVTQWWPSEQQHLPRVNDTPVHHRCSIFRRYGTMVAFKR